MITIWAAWYIYVEMRKARIHVWRKARMQAKEKGLPLDAVSMRSVQRDPEPDTFRNVRLTRAEERELASAPILTKHAPYDNPYVRDSYVKPYEIKYNRANDMSVYEVDGLSERVQLEEDIASRWRPGSAPAPSPRRSQYDPAASQPPSAFPQARPGGLRREPSNSALPPVGEDEFESDAEPRPAFPTPHPVQPQSSRFNQI